MLAHIYKVRLTHTHTHTHTYTHTHAQIGTHTQVYIAHTPGILLTHVCASLTALQSKMMHYNHG